jgi:hypothetical protein
MATTDQKSDTATRELNSQALALAEQLGRMAGTLEGTAETWLNRASLTDQLSKVRDGAAQLLSTLAGGASSARKAVQARPTNGQSSSAGKMASSRGRSASATADPAHAPGKQHRKPSPTVHGAKKSDSRIPKAKASGQARQRRKLYAK